MHLKTQRRRSTAFVIEQASKRLERYRVLLTAWCKSGTRTPGPGTSGPGIRDPPSTFKSGTPGPLQNLKMGPPDPLQSLKVGPPHLSLMNSFFFRIFHRFFIFVSFLNKIYTKKYQL